MKDFKEMGAVSVRGSERQNSGHELDLGIYRESIKPFQLPEEITIICVYYTLDFISKV